MSSHRVCKTLRVAFCATGKFFLLPEKSIEDILTVLRSKVLLGSKKIFFYGTCADRSPQNFDLLARLSILGTLFNFLRFMAALEKKHKS